MIETIAKVENNKELAPGYRLLTIDVNTDVGIRPGQFAMLKPHASMEPLLRRALAVYRVHSASRLSFLYQVLGRGTQALVQVESQDDVEFLGPLGNSWPVDELPSQQAIVVAGGIGSASVLTLCEALAASKIDSQVFMGAATERAAIGCGLEDFRGLKLPLTMTTDDGSLGERGFVTQPLERYLQSGKAKDATIYACGPWVMMKRVAELAADFQVRCLVSLEAPMGCGFGVCVGCVVAVNTESAGYDSYKRVCIDGSIFSADTIRWEINAMTH